MTPSDPVGPRRDGVVNRPPRQSVTPSLPSGTGTTTGSRPPQEGAHTHTPPDGVTHPPPMNPTPPPELIKAYYHSWQWRQLRTLRRQLDGNQCVQCGSTERLQVDHVVAIRDDWNRRAEINNLVSLCAVCHKLKTRAQRRARAAQKQRRSARAQALTREEPRRNSRRW
jgi:HNH endonuclease